MRYEGPIVAPGTRGSAMEAKLEQESSPRTAAILLQKRVGRRGGRSRFAAQSLAVADGAATMTGNVAADFLQMQQTVRSGFNLRL
jgi:hypothetical protein